MMVFRERGPAKSCRTDLKRGEVVTTCFAHLAPRPPRAFAPAPQLLRIALAHRASDGTTCMAAPRIVDTDRARPTGFWRPRERAPSVTR